MHAILGIITSICCSLGLLCIAAATHRKGLFLHYAGIACYSAALILKVVQSFHHCSFVDVLNGIMFAIIISITISIVRNKKERIRASNSAEQTEENPEGHNEADQHHP